MCPNPHDPKDVLSLLNHFFYRFFDDSIYVWDRKDIEIVVSNGSERSMKVSDAPIMEGLKAWEHEGRLIIGDNDSEFIKLNMEYWTRRTERPVDG
jgi:hypothetical protein